MSLTFKFKMIFSVLFLFQTCCINTEASISIHISARSTALLKAVFYVPLLYFEHLPLQRSLHGPAWYPKTQQHKTLLNLQLNMKHQ